MNVETASREELAAEVKRLEREAWTWSKACEDALKQKPIFSAEQAQIEAPLRAEIDKLRAALLDCARKAEALKLECSTDPESAQAVRNAQYQAISSAAHIALGTIRGATA